MTTKRSALLVASRPEDLQGQLLRCSLVCRDASTFHSGRSALRIALFSPCRCRCPCLCRPCFLPLRAITSTSGPLSETPRWLRAPSCAASDCRDLSMMMAVLRCPATFLGTLSRTRESAVPTAPHGPCVSAQVPSTLPAFSVPSVHQPKCFCSVGVIHRASVNVTRMIVVRCGPGAPLPRPFVAVSGRVPSILRSLAFTT